MQLQEKICANAIKERLYNFEIVSIDDIEEQLYHNYGFFKYYRKKSYIRKVLKNFILG